jgi:hypothetical protein
MLERDCTLSTLSVCAPDKHQCAVDTHAPDPYDRSPDKNQDYTAYWINRALHGSKTAAVAGDHPPCSGAFFRLKER